jgi:hypothetical protein
MVYISDHDDRLPRIPSRMQPAPSGSRHATQYKNGDPPPMYKDSLDPKVDGDATTAHDTGNPLYNLLVTILSPAHHIVATSHTITYRTASEGRLYAAFFDAEGVPVRFSPDMSADGWIPNDSKGNSASLTPSSLSVEMATLPRPLILARVEGPGPATA